MTMPNERTRSLIWAGEFLRELLDSDINPGLSERTKSQAIAVLRHYPSLSEIESLAQREEHGSSSPRPMLSSEEVRKNLDEIRANQKKKSNFDLNQYTLTLEKQSQNSELTFLL
jgi:hypothetical protein